MNREKLPGRQWLNLHYVRLPDVHDWLLCGWVASPALNGTHHGFWSALMIWPCDCDPVFPQMAKANKDIPEDVRESA